MRDNYHQRGNWLLTVARVDDQMHAQMDYHPNGNSTRLSAMTLHTSLSIDECRARLTSVIDVEKLSFSVSGYAGSKPVVGIVCGDDFRLQKRRFYRNSYAPCLFGRFIPAGSGTDIDLRFAMSAFVKWFTIGWLSFPGLLVVIVLMSVAMEPASLWDRAAVLLGLVGVMAGGVAVMKVGQMLGRNEERMLLAFIKSSLDASEKTLPQGNSAVQGSAVL